MPIDGGSDEGRLDLREMIKLHEGLRLFPYTDTQGFLTVGWGHNLSAKGLTHTQASMILTDDIAEAKAACVRAFPWFGALDEVRQAAMVDLCFNMGIASLSLFKTTLGLIRDGQYVESSKQLMNSLYARQVGHRAVRIAEMLRSGRWPLGA